jgi:transposase
MPKPSKVPLHVALPAQSDATTKPTSRPEKSKRRTFTAAEKLAIVRKADDCKPGEVEAMLREEGVYSSHLANWRKALRLYGEKGLSNRGPGRPPRRDERDERITRLEQDKARLEKELSLAKKLIDLQKKVSEILGVDLLRSDAP